jgi:MYXO-CTERM domain-containing protein
MMEGFPRVIDDWQFFNTPSIVDLDNDNDPEVVIGSGGYLLHAWDYLGNEPAGFPKQTGGWIIASVAVGDVDGDAKFDVSISPRDGWLFAWRTEGSVKSIFEWNGFGHDPMKTGNYENDPTPFAPWTRDVVEPGPEESPELVEEPGGEDATTTSPDVSAEAESEPTKKKDGGCAGGEVEGILGLLGLAGLVGRRRSRHRGV